MAASPPPPLPPPPPFSPTTITALSDDIIREIFLHLPDITTLTRAAFACPAFLHAVRSSPAFRRRFRQLHAPRLLALFREPKMRAIIPGGSGKSINADAFCAFNDLLLEDFDASESEWRTESIPYRNGYAAFFNRATDQIACYSPHTQALSIYPKSLPYDSDNDNDALLEFHTLSHDGEEQRPSRVVCVHHDRAWSWARVAVFSLHTMEWQVVLPAMELVDYEECTAGMVVNGFVCWIHKRKGCILALNTATFQFSRMELPPALIESMLKFQLVYEQNWTGSHPFQLGHTKDQELCVLSVLQCMLSVWLWATDTDGVERFMLHKTISLHANVSEITECSEKADVRMQPTAVINGFVYLSLIIDPLGDTDSPEWFLSFCLKTAEVNLLHKERRRFWCSFDPYIMVSWPSSLIHGKHDSETGVLRNISEDGGPIGKEEASPVLFTALRSFKEKLIDDGNSNFAEIESFLLDDERNSLLNRISKLESELAYARDRVLRIAE